jgi:hypothetical protein
LGAENLGLSIWYAGQNYHGSCQQDAEGNHNARTNMAASLSMNCDIPESLPSNATNL